MREPLVTGLQANDPSEQAYKSRLYEYEDVEGQRGMGPIIFVVQVDLCIERNE